MLSEWIYAVVASSAGAAALISIAAYLGRSQISHWLQKDLEAEKAKFQRELEAYKVSLIAQTEKIRAVQDVQKSMALKVAEKKLATFGALEATLFELQPVSYFSSLLSVALISPESNMSEVERSLFDVAVKVRKSVMPALPFMDQATRAIFAEYLEHFHTHLNELSKIPKESLLEKHPLWTQKAVELEKACEQVIAAFHQQTMEMIK